MKERILFLSILSCTTMSCKHSTTEPIAQSNLIMNSSFELDNTPTLQGWMLGNSHLTKLVNEAPPGGGNWSLQLTSDWAPTTGYVYTSVSNVKSGDILKLSAFVRATGQYGGRGIIELVAGPSFYGQSAKTASSTDTVWTQISLIDTVLLMPNDTLWVVLSSPITELIPFQQRFDLIELESQ